MAAGAGPDPRPARPPYDREPARPPDLRLIVITDAAAAGPRDPLEIATACIEAGAPAVQLRHKTATARELYDLALRLRPAVRDRGALLFINDRLDVALAAKADGVHLGPDDLPVAAARRAAPPDFLIGYSTDDPADAERAQAAGASYIGCGAVFGTNTKREVSDERIGPGGLKRVVRAVEVPVVGIGGIGPGTIGQVAATGAAGAAVVSAVMGAPDPATVVRRLLAAFPRPAGGG